MASERDTSTRRAVPVATRRRARSGCEANLSAEPDSTMWERWRAHTATRKPTTLPPSALAAAGVGAPTWLISVPGAWTRLGTSRYPWYPQVRTFTTPAFGNWTPVMDAVGEAVAEFVAER